MHGERVPDFMDGEKHQSLVVRQGAGAFHVLVYRGRIHVAEENFAAAAWDPALPGRAQDSDVAAICERSVIRHGAHDGTKRIFLALDFKLRAVPPIGILRGTDRLMTLATQIGNSVVSTRRCECPRRSAWFLALWQRKPDSVIADAGALLTRLWCRNGASAATANAI
jgi:hypothetical protein